MRREDIYREMEQFLGRVPSVFEGMPDATLEAEWHALKAVQLTDGAIPAKYRFLIGIGVAAALRCPYAGFYATQMARANGATDEEIEDAIHFAKSVVGWSTYLNGTLSGLEEWKAEVLEFCNHLNAVQVR